MQELKTPVLFLNFKTYKESSAENALSLAKLAEQAFNETGKQIVLVVQALDLQKIAGSVKIPVFVQHIDPTGQGSFTGKISPENAKLSGAVGTILNHAEYKLSNSLLEESIKKAKESGLKVMACAETIERAKQIASFSYNPDFIAVEPPELIGGNVSVSTASPEIISETVKEVQKIASIPVITGAGIKNSSDVRKALELGTKGVFVASGVVKAENQKKAILELLNGFL